MIYLELLWTFLKIGAFTFGGGYVMVPLIQAEVAAHGWLDATSLVNFIAVSESTPGPLAVNVATYVGAEVGGFFGAICATFGVAFPAFFIILIVAKCYEAFKSSKVVKGCMSVFFPQGVSASIFLDASTYVMATIFAISLFLALKKKSPILVICIAAVLGIVSGYLLI